MIEQQWEREKERGKVEGDRERRTERDTQRERRRERYLSSDGSLPKWLQQPGLQQSEVRKQEMHPGLPYRWQGPIISLSSQMCYQESE